MRLRFLLPAAVLVVLIVLFAFGLQHDPREVPSPLIGKPAPDFALRVVGEDTPFSRDDLLGRPLLVNFWARILFSSSSQQTRKLTTRSGSAIRRRIWYSWYSALS